MPPPDNTPDVPLANTGRDQILMRQAAAWLMRQAASHFSNEERRRFEAWLSRSPAHRLAYEEVRALWTSPEMDVAAGRLAVTLAANGVHAPRRRFVALRPMVALAAMLLLISLALWKADVLTWLNADHSTGIGERRVVTLSDDSIVTLNTDTAIAVHYVPHERRVRLLRGEASFSVRADAGRPFTVESRGVTTTAVGTRFLVRDHSGDVQVTVLSGAVDVGGGGGQAQATVRLAAGEQVSVGPRGAGPIAHVDGASTAAWIQGRLVFVRAPLAEVIRELGRYHRGYVAIWNPALRTLPVTGIYHLSDPSRIITTLAETLPIHAVRLTDHMIVLH